MPAIVETNAYDLFRVGHTWSKRGPLLGYEVTLGGATRLRPVGEKVKLLPVSRSVQDGRNRGWCTSRKILFRCNNVENAALGPYTQTVTVGVAKHCERHPFGQLPGLRRSCLSRADHDSGTTGSSRATGCNGDPSKSGGF